ncbi:hypothetical protein [Klebsiella pneumoniae]|uniref:hypothetical protein n=1 Tax=Klebsiella pneumoniae TaxID=573 RepID=UPI003D3FEAF1
MIGIAIVRTISKYICQELKRRQQEGMPTYFVAISHIFGRPASPNDYRDESSKLQIRFDGYAVSGLIEQDAVETNFAAHIVTINVCPAFSKPSVSISAMLRQHVNLATCSLAASKIVAEIAFVDSVAAQGMADSQVHAGDRRVSNISTSRQQRRWY